MAQPSLVRQRPAAVMVIAILHLVGGGINFLFVLCAGVMQAAGAASLFGQGTAAGPEQAEIARIQQQIQSLTKPAYVYGEMTADLVLDVMLLTAGIGLLYLRPWARILSLLYAVLAICNRLFVAVYTFAVIIPGAEAIFQQGAAADPKLKPLVSVMKISMTISAIVVALFIIYPIVVLIILNLRHVKAAFLAQVEIPPQSLPEDEGWGPIKRPGAPTDVRADPDRDQDRFQPPS